MNCLRILILLGVAVGSTGCVNFADEADRPDASSEADAGIADSGTADSGSTDSGTADSGTVDSGAEDSGTPDAGLADAGSDAGPGDAGTTDGGMVDGGPGDGGTTDAGGQDAGGCPGGMIALEGGTFTMGTRLLADGGADVVTVGSFCIDETEVTVAAFRLPDAGLAPTSPVECNGNRGDRQDHPANCVDWNEADAHCGLLGKRLPTEEEWEWAARGGTAAFAFPWGSTAPQNEACWRGASVPAASTCPVGAFPSGTTLTGVKDLAGNVWEWTSSCSICPGRVYRGGGWYDTNGGNLAVTLRYADQPATRNFNIGFRCVQSPQSP